MVYDHLGLCSSGMQHLQELDLSRNAIAWALPNEFKRAFLHLHSLRLSDNRFHGSIPDWIVGARSGIAVPTRRTI